ncbi:MAG: hypothetical protein HXX13_02370 [Bacteroidetes bacterium]|nr:hypothetical protein [Bacteroidota bacterium]
MLRISCLYLFQLMILSNVFCQSKPASVQKQLLDLQALCNSIQNENHALRSHVKTQDSLAYTRTRMEIFEAFNTAPRINFDFLNTTDKIAVTGLFTKLLQANNPTSDILGFRFNETLLKTAEKYFKNELKSEPDKIRLGQVINKLVNNPVISTLANTNPITSVTAAIINTMSSFSTTSIDVVKEGNKLKDVSSSTMDAFSQKNIEAFRVELQPYINFYDALNLASIRYLSGLENINQHYEYLKGSVEDYKKQLYLSLSITDTNTLMRLASSLPDPSTRNLDYSAFLCDQKIQSCDGIARKLPAIQLLVKDFRREYDQLLISFLKEYVLALQSAKKLPPSSIDQSKIDSLISDIDTFTKTEITKNTGPKK